MQQSAEQRAEPGHEEQRILAFGHAIDRLRRDVEAQLGAEDVIHIERVRRLSRRLEAVGRSLIHFSLEPLSFSAGVGLLCAHKSLELMEIGHMVLHGAYDGLSSDESLHARSFKWKAPIHEDSWRDEHNVRHHQYTNIAGRDPDLDFGHIRLSSRVGYRPLQRLQPLTNMATWLLFSTAINLHATGLVDLYSRRADQKPLVLRDRAKETVRAARRRFFSKAVPYYARELVGFPMLAGPFFWKVMLGNAFAEVGRDVLAGAIIYCGHVGATDYPEGTKAGGRARWYVMQVESARNVEVPRPVSILCGALDKQIEHHLFPRFPANRLRAVAPQVRAICEAHGVKYRSAGFTRTFVDVLAALRALSRQTRPDLAS